MQELTTLELVEPDRLLKIIPATELPTLPPGALKDGLTLRIGALAVHSLGEIVENSPYFHTAQHLFPLGYRSSRLFWSAVHPNARTLWVCVIGAQEEEDPTMLASTGSDNQGKATGEDTQQQQEGKEGIIAKPWFRIVAMDHPDYVYEGPNVEGVFAELLTAVKKCQGSAVGSLRELSASTLSQQRSCRRPQPCIQRSVPHVGSRVATYGLGAYDFVGLANPVVKRYLEELPGAAVAAFYGVDAHGSESEAARYRFCYSLPDKVASSLSWVPLR